MKKNDFIIFHEFVEMWYGTSLFARKLLAYVMLRNKNLMSEVELINYSSLKLGVIENNFSHLLNLHLVKGRVCYRKTTIKDSKFEEVMKFGLENYKRIVKEGFRRKNFKVGDQIIDGRVVIQEVPKTVGHQTKWVVQCTCGRKASISNYSVISRKFKGCPCNWISSICDEKLTELKMTFEKIDNEHVCTVNLTLNGYKGEVRYAANAKHKALAYAMADIGPRLLMNQSVYGYAIDSFERYI